MPAEQHAPVAAPDSPYVAAIKAKQKHLKEKLTFLDTQKTSEDHDIEVAKTRVRNQLLELDAALKGAK